ncbi:MAG TPA: hypothetical protein PLS81_12000 [Deltaproteobacteria bacterium]|nr:hypothetical protein [Deltaproteobacteria bacterium]HOM30163.1 hypothetical protein [Deltaproteobacteria bacterium]HPP80762.1 hypothetical protein [Deltaproteobacteria bacterium]
MDDRKGRELFAVLYEAATASGVEVIQDRLNRLGGVCRVNGRVCVILDERAPYREKNRLVIEGIAMVDYDAAYLPPKVRELVTRAVFVRGRGLATGPGEEAPSERPKGPSSPSSGKA